MIKCKFEDIISFDIMNHPAVQEFMDHSLPEALNLFQDNREQFYELFGEKFCTKRFEHVTDVWQVIMGGHEFLIFSAKVKGTSYEIIVDEDVTLNDFIRNKEYGKRCVKFLQYLMKHVNSKEVGVAKPS